MKQGHDALYLTTKSPGMMLGLSLFPGRRLSLMGIATEKPITLQQVADHFNVPVRTVRGWTRRKRNPLKSWKVGGKVYTTEQAVEEFAEPRHEPYEYDPKGTFATAEDARRNAAAIAKLRAKHNRPALATKEDIERCKQNSREIRKILGRE